MKKIRVLHLIKTLGLGGAETNLRNLVPAFDGSRFETHVGYSHGGEIESTMAATGAKLFKYAQGSHKIKSWATPLIVLRLAAYIRREKIDVIHTHNFNAHVWGLGAAKLTGRPLVEHVHDFRYMEPKEFSERKGATRQFAQAGLFKDLSDRVIVLTAGNERFLLDHHFYPRERIRRIANGIPPMTPTNDRAALKAKLGFPPDCKVVLTAARMSPEKNIGLVVDAAVEITRRHPDAYFAVAGDGPGLDALKRRAALSTRPANIHFLGFRPDVAELLRVSDIFLLPSFLELHSIAVLEAMELAVPMVLSENVGCHDEFIVSGENGILADPWRLDPWVEALDRLLGDEALRRAIGQSAHELARKRFGIRRAALELENLYVELAA